MTTPDNCSGKGVDSQSQCLDGGGTDDEEQRKNGATGGPPEEDGTRTKMSGQNVSKDARITSEVKNCCDKEDKQESAIANDSTPDYLTRIAQVCGKVEDISDSDVVDRTGKCSAERNTPDRKCSKNLIKQDSGVELSVSTTISTAVGSAKDNLSAEDMETASSTKDGSSDVDALDNELFVDSAVPSSFSESGADTKSEDSLGRKEDCMSVDNDVASGSPAARSSEGADDDKDDDMEEKSSDKKAEDESSNNELSDLTAADRSAADEEETLATSSTAEKREEENMDDDSQEYVSVRRRRRRRTWMQSSLSTDSDSDTSTDEDGLDLAPDSTDEDDDAEDPALAKPQPKHNWHALRELRQREVGYPNTVRPSLFRQRVQSSLHMVQRLELQYRMKYHGGCVNALCFNRIGSLLASGSDDLNIVLWNWLQNRPSLIYDSGHRSNVFQAKFMPYTGDLYVISCARDGQVRLAELSLTGVCKSTRKLAQHKGAAHKLALELDSSSQFLSCGEDALVYEIDLRQEKPNKLVVTKENDRKVALYSIHANPVDANLFCVGGRDHFIRVYDKRKIEEKVNDGVLKKFCPQHLVDSDTKANVTCACYSHDGTEILGSYNDEDIYLFDSSHSDGASYTHRYTGHRNNATVKGVNFYGPKSEYIVSGSDCGHVYLWEKETESVVQFMKGDDGGVINVLEPHPFLPVLATSGLDSDIKVWAPTLKEAGPLKGLNKTMKRNRRERDNERTTEPDMIDGQMLWFLMHHFRNSARRRRRAEGEEVSSSSDEDNSDSEDDPPSPNQMQCTQS